ncbi:O-linked GlcNAc transferase protein [Salinisphaera shabanensis E1L3A]|uniref:O-linked GlcNAc transferase protein n=1 Tax=Salinisphaera shabanensis E1L3A TaxID=1033802 RepID=F7QCZ7_9GAMM|nr:tetratricopeptide repeat protein [Salinisphaera shabanensis]ERJ18924.1 O-linked GlcNAc transferase protein [Salinisphaera shabanensis E1L3A]
MAEHKQEKDLPKRTRFVRPLTLLIIAVVLVVALVLLFPARRFLSLSQGDAGRDDPSSVSITYLEALLEANPGDDQLRLKLARQLAAAGNIPKAMEVMQPLSDSTDANARWLYHQISWQAFNGLEADDPRRDEQQGELIAQMNALERNDSLTPDQLETLARRWLELGRPARAADLYERLAAQDPARAYERYGEAARWWLAADAPMRAAQAWQSAFAATDDESQRRDAALAALDAAQQTNDGSSLRMAGEFIDAYPDDPTFLDIGIEMALANNRLAQAQIWSRRYVELRPDDEKGLERNAQIALANNRLDESLAGLQRLVERNPDNVALRAQLAQVQVWAGQPAAALANYKWLARRSGNDDYDNQIIDLGAGLNDTSAVLGALQRIQARHPLNASQRRLLVNVLNSEGDPDRAIAVLSNWVESGSQDRDLWVRLATLQAYRGNTDTSLATWNDIASRFGRRLDETQARARLLAEDWQTDKAIAVLRSLPDKPPADTPDQVYYWQTLGELAWNQNQPEAAREAYYQLYLARKLDSSGYIRLVETAVATDHMDMAMEVARSDWRENKHADIIVAMLGAAQREDRPELTRELIAMAQTRPALFAQSPYYWQYYGDYQFEQRKLGEARRAYLKALSLAPNNTGVRTSLLSTLAQGGYDEELARYVNEWSDEATNSPSMWSVFALANSELGQTNTALRWYDRAVHYDPDNYLLVLDYADALERGRRFDSARRMREYALMELRPRLLADLQAQGKLTRAQREQNRRILAVQAEMLGNDGRHALLGSALNGRSGDDLTATDIELLLGYYLSEQEPSYARYWLLQAHRRRVTTEDWQQLAVALQANDQVAMQRILARSRENADIGIADRITALRQLDFRARALTLALDHERPSEPYVTGIDTVPRYAAELYQTMPQNFGTELIVRSISDLEVNSESVFLRLSGEKLSTRVELGARQLSADDDFVDMDGLEDERYANLVLNWRERRGTTTVRVGAISTDAENTTQFGLRQDYQLTDNVSVAGFINYNELPDETGQYRVLGLRDDLGFDVDWVLNARDSLSLTATYSKFYSREERNDLGDGYSVEASLAHYLMVGPTHQVQARVFASTEQNFLEDDLPSDMAARLPADTDLNDVVPTRYTFLGAGLSFARGIPGEEYPLVASPRYQLDIDAGYVLPDNDIGISANFAIGTRILGSDELSLNFGVDQTGSQTQDNSYSGSIKYQYFLGR